MACKNICKLCPKLVISQRITVLNGSMNIDIPTGEYGNGRKYCLVLAQPLPPTATINMPVNVTIGNDTTVLYPLYRPNGVQVTASGLRTRTRYATHVTTTETGGFFTLVADIPCIERSTVPSIPAT